MKTIILTEEQIHEDYVELSKVLSGIDDKDIFENLRKCRIAESGEGRIIDFDTFLNSFLQDQVDETDLNH